MLLTISLLAPFVGPLLLVPLQRSLRAAAGVDGFVLVAMAGLICLHALPESIGALGWPAVVAAIAGLVLPKIAHGAHAPHDGAHACKRPAAAGWIGVLAACALLLHALADGVGLVQPTAADAAHLHAHGHAHTHDHGHAWLPWAVALHRLVEGTGLWWLLRAQRRVAVRWLALAALGGATLIGFRLGAWAQAGGFAPVVALLQASVAGSLAHVLLWHAPALPQGGTAAAARRGHEAAASALGGILAATLLLALSASEGELGDIAAALATQLPRLAQAGVGAAVGLALAATLHALGAWPAAPRQPQLARWRQALAGAVAGLREAACSCGVLPLAAALRRRGATNAYASAFVAAAPALGLVALAQSLLLLGPALTALRALGVVVLALGVGLTARPSPAAAAAAPRPPIACHPAQASPGLRLRDGVGFALGEVLDFTGPWLACGLGLALAIDALVPGDVLPQLALDHWDVPVLTLLAAPLYLCAAASTLVATALLAKGASAAAVLAFLWSSSSLSPALWSVWRRGELSGTPARYTAVLLGGACAFGLALTQCHLGRAHGTNLTLYAGEWGAPVGAALAAGIVGRALWRQGVRGAAAQLASSNRVGTASHHHGAA